MWWMSGPATTPSTWYALKRGLFSWPVCPVETWPGLQRPAPLYQCMLNSSGVLRSSCSLACSSGRTGLA